MSRRSLSLSTGQYSGRGLGALTPRCRLLAQTIPAALTGFLGGINRNVPIIAASVTVALAGVLFWLIYKAHSGNRSDQTLPPKIVHSLVPPIAFTHTFYVNICITGLNLSSTLNFTSYDPQVACQRIDNQL